MIDKKKSKLLRRRKIALVSSVLLVALLIACTVFVNYIVKIEPFYDIDETKYLVKYKSGSYALYDTDGNKLPVDAAYGCFVTDIGTLVKVDTETGAASIKAVVDTEDTEAAKGNKVMMFEHHEKKDISSLEVHNSEGSFTFYRFNTLTGLPDNTSDFSIKGAPYAEFDVDLFTELHVTAGYTITSMKIDSPIKDANGEFSEYGLVPEQRIDEEGNPYEYTPAYYILTDMNGNKHKVLVGDLTVTGEGYYVQYVKIENGTETKRDAVYIISAEFGDSLLRPVEDFVTPMVAYPSTITTYFDVQDFSVSVRNGDTVDKTVGFSFIDLAERENTVNVTAPFIFTSDNLDGYMPDVDNIYNVLETFYQMEFVGVKKLVPSRQDLIDCKLAIPTQDEDGKDSMDFRSKYTVTFKYEIPNDDGSGSGKILNHLIFISEPNEDGNYYAYTLIYDVTNGENKFLYTYDMIVEIAAHELEFLKWTPADWTSREYVQLNIAFADTLKIEAPGYSSIFKLDNSKTDMSQGVLSTLLEVEGSDSNGNHVRTFSNLVVTDLSGNVWTITEKAIKAVNAAGTELRIDSSYYAYNKLGVQVRANEGQIRCNDGRRVEVKADEVIVTEANGETTTYIRYATTLFRRYWETISASSVEDSYEMTAEEEAALISDPSKWLLTMTIKTTDGNETVYSFYKLTNRKAYITINGNGGFYVLPSRVEKIIKDSQRFFAFEVIDPVSKK
ncbi:MAG: hypothetical protein E7641_06665 [Ruminococcaceae bacterium]|nr:hypothetical protein [Oscillospiraceae bacterium]